MIFVSVRAKTHYFVVFLFSFIHHLLTLTFFTIVWWMHHSPQLLPTTITIIILPTTEYHGYKLRINENKIHWLDFCTCSNTTKFPTLNIFQEFSMAYFNVAKYYTIQCWMSQSLCLKFCSDTSQTLQKTMMSGLPSEIIVAKCEEILPNLASIESRKIHITAEITPSRKINIKCRCKD